MDPATHSARAYVTLETGERYRFGPTIDRAELAPRRARARYLRYQEGDWYDAESLLRTQFALDDSQYFAIVEVLPEERDRKNKVAAVRITSEPNRRHVYRIGVGYGSDTGARGTLGWEDRRLNTRGHRLHAETPRLRHRQLGDPDLHRPLVRIPRSRSSYQLRVFREQNADIETEGTTFKVGLTQVRGSGSACSP